MVEEEKVKRILGELMKEAFRDELLDAYLNGKEVAICLTPRGLEKFEGEKNKVEIPNDAEFCIHTHFYSEEFSPADLKVAKKLPVCTYYVGPENGQEKVKCIYNNELLALAEEYPEIKEVLERTQDWFNAEYNLREIVKQLILLEDHYLKARCSDCITKHLLAIEGYAEEGAKLRNGDKYLDLFNEVHDLALKHLEIVHTSIHEDKAVNVYDMLQEVRELRKKIMYKLFNIEPELNESVKQEVIPDQWRWSELKPKTKAEREELLKKFGARCFLDPKSLKFPICAYPSGAISCDGLRAAYVRARSLMGATKDRHPELYKYYSKIAERALELAKKFGCEWVKGHEEVREGEEFFRELEEELEEQSPIRWTGGKRYLVKTLKQYIPPHRVYVEPFAGAAWLYWNKEPAEVEVLNDIDPRLMRFYKELREIDDIKAVIDKYGWADGKDVERARALFEKVKEILENWERAGREEFVWAFLYVNKLGYGAKMGRPSFNPASAMPPKCKEKYCAIRGLLRNFEKIKARLKRTILENEDFRVVIRKYDSPETFFYLDPPYYETGERDSYISNINGDTPTPEEVFEAVKDIKGKFLLSYNNHPKIRELAQKYGFRVVEVTTRYELGKTPSNGSKLAKELLIMNF